jgi:ABC-type glycerol-3-phosphate transport system substrate-binding protein
MKLLAIALAAAALCAGCKPVSALPDPGITVTTITVPGH